MIWKPIIYWGSPVVIACDANCKKAWGITNRHRNFLCATNIDGFPVDDDDYEFLADTEIPDAPEDPGTYEGGCAKPRAESERLNKWCCRECERCVMTKLLVNTAQKLELPDFSKRRPNITR